MVSFGLMTLNMMDESERNEKEVDHLDMYDNVI